MKDKDEILDEKIKKEYFRKGMCSVIFSLFLGLIPWLLYLYCSIIARGGTSENDQGAAWWGFVGYWYSFGIPILIMAILFADKAIKYTKKIKSKYYYLSIIALILGWLPIISLFILIFTMPLRT